MKRNHLSTTQKFLWLNPHIHSSFKDSNPHTCWIQQRLKPLFQSNVVNLQGEYRWRLPRVKDQHPYKEAIALKGFRTAQGMGWQPLRSYVTGSACSECWIRGSAFQIRIRIRIHSETPKNCHLSIPLKLETDPGRRRRIPSSRPHTCTDPSKNYI